MGKLQRVLRAHNPPAAATRAANDIIAPANAVCRSPYLTHDFTTEQEDAIRTFETSTRTHAKATSKFAIKVTRRGSCWLA